MSVDQSKLSFWSDANYMKRDDELSGDVSLTLGSAGTYTTYTITHNYGYIPFFDVYGDLSNDGVIWAGEKIDQYTDSNTTGDIFSTPTLLAWSTNTVLTIKILNNTNPAATGSRTVYWVLYKDYGNAR